MKKKNKPANFQLKKIHNKDIHSENCSDVRCRSQNQHGKRNVAQGIWKKNKDNKHKHRYKQNHLCFSAGDLSLLFFFQLYCDLNRRRKTNSVQNYVNHCAQIYREVIWETNDERIFPMQDRKHSRKGHIKHCQQSLSQSRAASEMSHTDRYKLHAKHTCSRSR